MSKYKRLLKKCIGELGDRQSSFEKKIRLFKERIELLELAEKQFSKRIKHLECEDHKWIFVDDDFRCFVHKVYYNFKCVKCNKQISRFEADLTGTMRPQLELLGYLESKKKTKKEKS